MVTLPAGADGSNTDPNGGTAGTGLLDIRNLSLAGLGDSVLIEFAVVLAAVIPNGSYVANQSEITLRRTRGCAERRPEHQRTGGPERRRRRRSYTVILIQSAPVFDIDKISTYMTGDPNVLLAGETLRYTITVQNVGTDNAVDVEIVDLIPANTTYIAGSTTLNGIALAGTTMQAARC